MSSNLVSTEWLAMRLGEPDIVIIDASWHLPATKRNAKSEFVLRHIPGAQFYDLDAGSAPNTALPHMLPPAAKFSSDMEALGVGDGKTVVVYDAVGLFSAARLWWMLQSFGHRYVSVLNGGLPKWLADGHPAEVGGASPVPQRHLTVKLDRSKVKSSDDVAAALESRNAQVADARSAARFRGEEPEARPGVRSGHMPGAVNLHYSSLLNTDGTLKKRKDLREAFDIAGIDLKRPVITSCGSGVTAAILMLAMAELGVKDAALYDGSWAEWGTSERAVVTGA
jgi:thiosulfate/3-mercaptopyruvate sulfurtransferase